jgi:formylglycine-generating enzyme required for sulfatase activity
MPFNAQRQLVELDDFLAALRVNGVSVHPADIERLRRLFALEPPLDRHGLQTMLSALLVKTPTQRERFEALFAEWCPDHDADWPEDEEAERDKNAESISPDRRLPPELPPFETLTGPERHARRPILTRLAAAVGIALLVALLVWWWWPRPVISPPPEPKPRPVSVPPEASTDPDALPATPVDFVWFWKADVKTKAIRVSWRLGPLEFTLLGLAALATAAAAYWRYRQQFPDLPPTSQAYVGYGWQPLPPLARDDSALIDARDRRQLVWNIEHFVSDDPTRRLDLPQTVDATAKAGGYVELRFQPAVYDREIWFWLDRQLDRTTPRTAVQQLTATLAAGGLYAHQGWFTDLPDRVDWPEQHGYHPGHEEGHGRQALVAIFSDGEGLAQRLNNPLYRPATVRLLRDLRRWPRLCFVDCSPSGVRLTPLLQPFGLEVVALHEVPHWLGGVESTPPSAAPLGAGLYGYAGAWAAAVALGGQQTDTASAQSLRLALRLRVSPWLVDQVLAEAAAGDHARRHINWLLRREPLGANNLPQPGSLARRALRWWWRRYAEAERRMQAQENPLLPWQHSLASRRWELEQALLQLYLDPEGAARQLSQLADEELQDEVCERLAMFAAADHQHPDSRHDGRCIFLTWRFVDLPAATRHTLRRLGFAAEVFENAKPPEIKQASRLVLAGTILIMLALNAFGAAINRYFTPEPPQVMTDKPSTYDHPAFRVQTVRVTERMLAGTYRVTLGSARKIESLSNVPEGADIPVTWTWFVTPNHTEVPGSNTVLLRAGRVAQPIRPCSDNWPQRSLVVIAASYKDDTKARQLAIRLLDTGSADQVLVGTDWEEPLAQRLGSSPALNQNTQVLIILPDAAAAERAKAQLAGHPGPWAVVSSGDFAELARVVKFPGSKTLDQAPQELRKHLRMHGARGDVRLVGGPGEPQIDSQTGIAWVHVCPGTFTMGTVEQDGKQAMQMARPLEKVNPPRTVILSAFDIAATETTQAQVVKIDPEQGKQYDKKDGNLPVNDIDWGGAQKVCQKAGGDLPTEAQWEYAARGGSRFPWSFGDNEALLKDYAWYVDNTKGAQEVGQKRPNLLGLYDMHGNVWEWARDWYSDYVAGVIVDPAGAFSGKCSEAYIQAVKRLNLGVDTSQGCRVIRGGSFAGSPGGLRSAVRGEFRPGDRSSDLGGRCVRVPPP